MEKIVAAITDNISILQRQDQRELASIFRELMRVVMNEPSETFDREALLKQVQVLTEQATIPKVQRKRMQVSASLFYLSLFSAVRGIGVFLIEQRRFFDFPCSRYWGEVNIEIGLTSYLTPKRSKSSCRQMAA